MSALNFVLSHRGVSISYARGKYVIKRKMSNKLVLPISSDTDFNTAVIKALAKLEQPNNEKVYF